MAGRKRITIPKKNDKGWMYDVDPRYTLKSIINRLGELEDELERKENANK